MNEELGPRLFEQVIELFVNPEINRRVERGQLAQHFQIYAVQVLFEVGKPVRVRINDEVIAVAQVLATRPISKGEAITTRDFSDMRQIELTERDPNAGHITMFRKNAEWWIAFDFRYNAARVKEVLDTAREFLDSARADVVIGRTRACAASLYTAVELLARGTLMLLPEESILKSKTHKFLVSEFNRWVNMGNAENRFAKLINELSDLRNEARYPRGQWSIDTKELKAFIEDAEEMHKQLKARIPARHSIPEKLGAVRRG